MTKKIEKNLEISQNSWKTSEKVVVGSAVSAFWLGAIAGLLYLSGKTDLALGFAISAAASLGVGVAAKGYKDCKKEDLFVTPSAQPKFFAVPKVTLSSLVPESKPLISAQDRDLELDEHPQNRETYIPPDLSV